MTPFLLALFLVTGLPGCSDKKTDDPKPVVVTNGKAIVVQENNGTAYNLSDVSLIPAGGGSAPRVWLFSGKLRDGRVLQVQYTESGLNTGRADNISQAALGNFNATQRNGQMSYSSTNNTLSGTFSLEFAGPLNVTGSIQNFPL